MSYQAVWPNGSPNHPTSIQYLGPYQANGHPYPQIQFETDVAGSEILCNVATGAGCTAPPIGSSFYPFWSLGLKEFFSPSIRVFPSTGCAWNFGNNLPNTLRYFGKDAQYGTPDVARFGGTIISAPAPNPQDSVFCRAL